MTRLVACVLYRWRMWRLTRKRRTRSAELAELQARISSLRARHKSTRAYVAALTDLTTARLRDDMKGRA